MSAGNSFLLHLVGNVQRKALANNADICIWVKVMDSFSVREGSGFVIIRSIFLASFLIPGRVCWKKRAMSPSL